MQLPRESMTVPHFINVLTGPGILGHPVCLLLGHSNLLGSLFLLVSYQLGSCLALRLVLPIRTPDPKGRTCTSTLGEWHVGLTRVWWSGCKRWQPIAERVF